MNSRRSFFQDAALLSALASLATEEGFSQAQPKDPKLSNFWDAYFDEAERDPTHISRSTPDADLLDPARRVQLIHATDNGLVYPDAIDAKQLLPAPDVVLTLNPAHFRPNPADLKLVAKTKGCQIRVDCVQTRPIMNLIAPMAWSGLAAWSQDKTIYSTSNVNDPKTGKPAIDPKTGKNVTTTKVTAGPAVPSLQQLDFTDPNAPGTPVHNQVVLPGGSGRLALNVRGVSQNQRLQAVLDKSVNYSSIVAPFFGFAPLAIPALRAFTTLLGAVFNHESVIMNSMPVQVLATQDAWSNPKDSSAMKIVNGDYIAVPVNQAADLKDTMGKLRMVNGWLVHQDSPATLPVEQRAQDPKIPEITYLSLSINVQSLDAAQQNKAKGG